MSSIDVLHFGEDLPDLLVHIEMGRFSFLIIRNGYLEPIKLVDCAETSVKHCLLSTGQILGLDEVCQRFEGGLRRERLKGLEFLLLCHG